LYGGCVVVIKAVMLAATVGGWREQGGRGHEEGGVRFASSAPS